MHGFDEFDDEGEQVLGENELFFLDFGVEGHGFADSFELDVDEVIVLVVVEIQVFVEG